MIMLSDEEFSNRAFRCNEFVVDDMMVFRYNGIVFSSYPGYSSLVVGERKEYATAGKLFGSVTIPSSATDPNGNSYNVVGIGRYAFYNCTNLFSVNVNSNIQFIEEYAFYNCYNLIITVIFMNALNIGRYAFYSCRKIMGIEICDSIYSNSMFPTFEIGEYAFCDCHLLKYFHSHNHNPLAQIIGDCAFKNCYSLIDINILNIKNLTEIGCYAFQSTKIASITFNMLLRKIGDGAFSNCTKLTSINYANNKLLEEIPNNCFSFCSSLESITLPMSLRNWRLCIFQMHQSF
jgi:hypothetical protein